MSTGSDRRLKLGAIKRWPSRRAKSWAINELSCFASNSDTAAIIAIGSAVRSMHHRGSDVDFLVVSDTETTTDASRPIEVDLRTFRTSEVNSKVRECDEFLASALRFGCTIFDREGFWARVCAQWADQLPFPSPELSIRRALRCARFASQLVSMGDLDAALEQVIGMLTHTCRAKLFAAHVYPASRPELPAQVRELGEHILPDSLDLALQHRQIHPDILRRMKATDAVSVPYLS